MSQRSFDSNKTTDHDFVKPSKIRRTQQPLPDLSSFEQYPNFTPLSLEDRQGGPNLPNHLDLTDPLQLFDLFFPLAFIQYCVRCTNANAKRIRAQGPAGRAKWSRFRFSIKSRSWQDIKADAIYAYLGIYIYMNLYPSPRIEDYWSRAKDQPQHACVRNTMGLKKWQQIHRYFHIWDPSETPTSPGQRVRPMDKMKQVADLLREEFKTYWTPGTHVAVDEAIAGFTGRTPEIVNIPSKPVPVGYKLWVLAARGYVLDFLFHVRGDKKDQGPQGLRTQWKELGFNPTQSVVCELVTRLPSEGRGSAVWLDNLFTNGPQCRWLRTQGIGCSGTVRTSQTEREENEEKRARQNKRKRLIEEDVYATVEDDLQASQSQSQFPATFDSQALTQIATQALDCMAYATQSSSQQEWEDVLNPALLDRAPSPRKKRKLQAKTDTRTPLFAKEPGFGMHPMLVELKTKWTRQIECGRTFYHMAYASHPGEEVLQIAWRDSSMVLFMTTACHGNTLINKWRKRPAIAAKDPMLRTYYGDLPVKELPILEVIDQYNHKMNAVDLADQLRSQYRTPRKVFKTWRPLWDYLFWTAICNLVLLALDAAPEQWPKKKSGHAKFRKELGVRLMKRYNRKMNRKPYQLSVRRTQLQNFVSVTDNGCQGELVNLGQKDGKYCKVCQANKQGVRHRKPLEELSINTFRKLRTRRTSYGCSVCKIPVCRVGECWKEHQEASSLDWFDV